MKPSPSAPREWMSLDPQILRADLSNSDVKEPTVMERGPTGELRSRLLRMILDNEQLRKSHDSSTPIDPKQLDA